jgi:SH3-like domain-containing protein
MFAFLSFLFIISIGPLKAEQSLAVPRFVSVRSNAVNMHVGPGIQYPVEWRYVRTHFPLEVIAEFDTWRQVRDFQGTQGWVHKSLLNGKRFVIIVNKTRSLRQNPSPQSNPVAYAEPGTLGRALECQGDWCKIEVKDASAKSHKGWVKRRALWGVYPNETKF